MKINFFDFYFTKKYHNSLINAFDTILKTLNVKCLELEIDVSFVSKKRIKMLNNQKRGINRVTDVLSFPTISQNNNEGICTVEDKLNLENFKFFVNPETNNIMLGEIIICKSWIKKQAKTHGNTTHKEVIFLFVHGVMHLLGYDHIKKDDELLMREKEIEIMNILFPNEKVSY